MAMLHPRRALLLPHLLHHLLVFLLPFGTNAQCHIQFSPHITDHMVLQRSPSIASVFGTLNTTSFSNDIAPVVTITVTDEESGAETSSLLTEYTVAASVSRDDVDNDSESDVWKWNAQLQPTPAGGSYLIDATCSTVDNNPTRDKTKSTAATTTTSTISIKDVTFGDVYFCAGQSNMELPLRYTFSRNASLEAIQSGRYNNIRIYSHGTRMDRNDLGWMSVKDAAAPVPVMTFDKQGMGGIWSAWRQRRLGQMDEDGDEEPRLFSFSSTCYYFAESLTDIFYNMSSPAPPLGLINVAVGGSRLQRWAANVTLDKCRDFDNPDAVKFPSQELYDSNVIPFAEMTLKGFLWYQGEENMGEVFGNVIHNRGYSCALAGMVSSWRHLFNNRGMTSPQAPFGIVTLTQTGSEGHPDEGGMHWAHTGNYGTLPSPALPHTFLAHAFDADDPFSNRTCAANKCESPDHRYGAECQGCEQYAVSTEGTKFNGSPIHPRDKKIVGWRLARAGFQSVYGGDVSDGGAYSDMFMPGAGPVLSGCRLEGDQLVIKFNSSNPFLVDNVLKVGEYYQPSNATYLQILTNKTLFCLQTRSIDDNTTACLDDGTGTTTIHSIPSKQFNSQQTWPMVPVTTTPSSSSQLVADVSQYINTTGVFAVRYAWMYGEGWTSGCCSFRPPTSDPCPVASCPLMGGVSGLPVTPFVALIDTETKRCRCIPPQVCDD